MLKPYRIDYRKTPTARKVLTVTQYHPSAEVAETLSVIRQYDANAVCVAVRELTDEEHACMVAGWNPFE